MEDIRISSLAHSLGHARTFRHSSKFQEDPKSTDLDNNRAQLSSEDSDKTDSDETDSDELNAKGAFNHSSLHIVKTSELV